MPAAAVDIVVIHYRTPELLLECLERLALYAPAASTLVVDTSGVAGDLTAARRSFPEARFVETVNHSLANAVNTGLKQTEAPFVLQMNADVMLAAGTLEAMLERLQRPSVGMVGPRCRTPGGAWQNQGILYRPYYAYLEFSKAAAVPVPWLSGCCQMVRREVLTEVGGMNSSFRFYNEDVEWCWRLRRAGYRCELVRAWVLHVGGASTPADERFMLEGLRGGMILSRQYKSRLYRSLHRQGVRRYAEWRCRNEGAGVYTDLASMFAAKRFDESPFGDTLNDENPAFLRGS